MSNVLIFSRDGRARCIYDDKLISIMRAVGNVETRRASHVEPTHDGRWTADMSPVRLGVTLGPFDTREEALTAEREWLEAEGIPIPGGSK